MKIEDVNVLCQEIAEENAAQRMADYLTELEEEQLDELMALHMDMLYACESYDEDACYYGA